MLSPARWSVFSRCVAAAVGGYALATSLSTAIVALVASGFGAMARVDAVLVAMQLSFVVYAGAVMWAFAARSARGAWLGLALPSLLSALVAWALL
ncbi:DUF3649 domain-containing protein [Variovorax sp. UMC13]|uniref:DUF3649 domain-containing protein n=1 Tax=Variovorax sp. UMC13 TaxID=1862326 RepID=UPI00287BC685|nr:DUF3649 domain-containing protein [Variovorax sp. UMC13]